MEELLGRQAPHSAAAEQAVIGSMLIDTRCIPDVIERLKGAEFYVQQNRDIFETVYAMFSYGQTIDPVTVLDQMKVRGVYREGSPEYLAELMRITPTAANVLEYAAIVRDRALLRNLASAADEINNLVYDGSGEAENILEAAESKIYALRQGRNIGGLLPISTVVQTVYENISEAASSGRVIPGLSTGLKDLDKYILGLNKGELILIAARPAMGKTSIALNIAMDVAKHTDKTVAVFSLEMSREQLMNRLFAAEGGIDSRRLLTGELSTEDWVKVAELSPQFGGAPLYMDDTAGITVAEMKAKLRRVRDLGLVVIDYLQLMSTGRRSDNRVQEVSEITRSLKVMAKELNVPVITLSQLSRGTESRSDHRPMLSDLRESGSIEQDADIVLFLYREAYYEREKEDQSEAECIIAKNRHGETGSISLRWDGRFTRFFGVDRNRE